MHLYVTSDLDLKQKGALAKIRLLHPLYSTVLRVRLWTCTFSACQRRRPRETGAQLEHSNWPRTLIAYRTSSSIGRIYKGLESAPWQSEQFFGVGL
jgi:hypothetical protein